MPAFVSTRVRFLGALGDTLTARIDRSPTPPRSWALFAHCFSCSKDLKAVTRISRALVDRNIGVMRFDFTGLGESEGDFADTNFSSNLDDLAAAADYMRGELAGPRLLIGHSLGGAAVLAAAERIPESVAVATIAAPSDTANLGDVLLRINPEIESHGEAEVSLGGRTFRIKKQLIDDLNDHALDRKIRGLGRALLVLHSPVDEVIGIDHARRIFEVARHPKSFVSLDNADHLLLRAPRDARYVADVLAAWAGRYIDAPEEMAPAGTEGEVTVRGGTQELAQEVVAGRHQLTADEPHSVGGDDSGPTPYDFLLAGLGACTNITLLMYAKRKGWSLDYVESRLRHDRIHAEDCGDCETTAGRVDQIEQEIQLDGPLDEAQRTRLMEIAGRCPVHRTLAGEIKIRTSAVKQED